MNSSFEIRPGFDERDRAQVAALFWQAFSTKLVRILGPKERGVDFFARIMDPSFAISAYDNEGSLLGVAGFKTSDGALTAGKFSDLRDSYGLFGATWRLAPLLLLERELAEGILLMDGIFVAEHARSRGIGSALLDAVRQEAIRLQCHSVRLDVIGTNPKARALYERKGFKAEGRHDVGPFKWLFGFSYATTMTLAV